MFLNELLLEWSFKPEKTSSESLSDDHIFGSNLQSRDSYYLLPCSDVLSSAKLVAGPKDAIENRGVVSSSHGGLLGSPWVSR